MNVCEHCGHHAHLWVKVRYGPLIAILDGELGRCSDCECAVDIFGRLMQHKIKVKPLTAKQIQKTVGVTKKDKKPVDELFDKLTQVQRPAKSYDRLSIFDKKRS